MVVAAGTRNKSAVVRLLCQRCCDAAMTAPRPATAWTRVRTPSGVWRLEHPNGSVIFVDRDASEDEEVQRRMAEAESTIRRLIAGRKRP